MSSNSNRNNNYYGGNHCSFSNHRSPYQYNNDPRGNHHSTSKPRSSKCNYDRNQNNYYSQHYHHSSSTETPLNKTILSKRACETFNPDPPVPRKKQFQSHVCSNNLDGKQNAAEMTIQELSTFSRKEEIDKEYDHFYDDSDDGETLGRTLENHPEGMSIDGTTPKVGLSIFEKKFIQHLPTCNIQQGNTWYCPCGPSNKEWRERYNLEVNQECGKKNKSFAHEGFTNHLRVEGGFFDEKKCGKKSTVGLNDMCHYATKIYLQHLFPKLFGERVMTLGARTTKEAHLNTTDTYLDVGLDLKETLKDAHVDTTISDLADQSKVGFDLKEASNEAYVDTTDINATATDQVNETNNARVTNERIKWVVTFNDFSYQHYEPATGNALSFRCVANGSKNIKGKPSRCEGSFKLLRWPNSADPQLILNVKLHDCCKADPNSLPNISTVFTRYHDILSGKDEKINNRTTKKTKENYRNFLKRFKESSEADTCLSSKTLPDHQDDMTLLSLESDKDDRIPYYVVPAPYDIREQFITKMSGLISVENKNLWSNLVGGNKDRWLVPNMKEKQPKMHDEVLEASDWYIKTVQRHYPKLTPYKVTALLSAPKAHAQANLHVDYLLQSQCRPIYEQPVSAIIAIEAFTLDIVESENIKKLKTVTVEPGSMIIFTNKCIHRGGANQLNKYSRRIFLYFATVEADIDDSRIKTVLWDDDAKKYTGHERQSAVGCTDQEQHASKSTPLKSNTPTSKCDNVSATHTASQGVGGNMPNSKIIDLSEAEVEGSVQHGDVIDLLDDEDTDEVIIID